MAIDRTTFILRYPEFSAAGDDLLDQILAEAVALVSAVAFGPRYEVAVYKRAAILLARSPFGTTAKLVNKSGETVYDRDFEELKRAAAIGGRVC